MTTDSEYILTMDNITKDFPGVRALDDVTINGFRGEILGLVGENGAGKSTLMKILTGNLPYGTFTGKITINGDSIEFHSPHDAHLKAIGFVPQEINVVDSLSISENIVISNYPGRVWPFISLKKIHRQVESFLSRHGIGLNCRDTIASCSTSQKQLTMVARALWNQPSVLVLDEPTSSLTQSETKVLFKILDSLRAKGVLCILITHKLDEVFEMADRVTILRDGKYIATYTRDQFDQSQIVTDMVGRKIDNVFPSMPTVSIDEHILSVRNLTVPHPHIQSRNLLENISFDLKHKEILGLAGLVGSGRSEVVRAIYGCYPHVSGDIVLEGRHIRIRKPSDALKCGLALITEDRKTDGLLFNMTIQDNITLTSYKRMTRWGFIDKKQETSESVHYLRLLETKVPSLQTPVGNLSGGNQQKLLLGRALMQNPKILMLDEPTRGIDVGVKYEIYKLIQKLVNTGVSIILITSEMPELLALCDRFLVLANGRICDEFDKSQASEERIMLAATGLRTQKPIQ